MSENNSTELAGEELSGTDTVIAFNEAGAPEVPNGKALRKLKRKKKRQAEARAAAALAGTTVAGPVVTATPNAEPKAVAAKPLASKVATPKAVAKKAPKIVAGPKVVAAGKVAPIKAGPKVTTTKPKTEIAVEPQLVTPEAAAPKKPKKVKVASVEIETTETKQSVTVAVVETSVVEVPAVVAPIAEVTIEAQPATVIEPVVVEETTPVSPFLSLNLRDEVHQAILKSGYDQPTAVQSQIIPLMLAGRDVLAQSQTGTGKTAAFALPILSRIDVEKRKTQILVLAPTRELAIQVANSFTTYASCLKGVEVAAIYGGSDYDAQFRQLRRGVQIVVGTPGRVIDHIERGSLNLDDISCLVLDEADEMLNMGFLEDVQFVLEKTPANRQIALFSATLPGPIREIAQQYLNDPAKITVKQKTMTADSIQQRAVFVAPRDKIDVLTRFLEAEETDGVIVFTRTREASVQVAEELANSGLSAIALNGDMQQKVRERTIEQLKNGKLNILVATDVAARGLDVSRISHVFNFDLPHDSESYIHRVGRTGRMGRSGQAIIFLTRNQRHRLRSIEMATKQPIELVQPPTADDINKLRISRLKKQIVEVAASEDLKVFTNLIESCATESGQPMEKIAAALAHISQGGRTFLMTERGGRKDWHDRDERGGGRDGRDRQDRNDNGRSRFSGGQNQGMERYRIEVGRRDGVRPGNIVGAVANEAGIDGDMIGAIRIEESYSTIELPVGMSDSTFQTLKRARIGGKPMMITNAGSAASAGGNGSNDDSFRPRRGSPFRKDDGPREGGGKGKASFARGKKTFRDANFKKPRAQA